MLGQPRNRSGLITNGNHENVERESMILECKVSLAPDLSDCGIYQSGSVSF